MFETRQELLDKIRLGEDSVLELKAVRFRGKRLEGPDRKDLADELAALANSRGGVCVLGVDDQSREIEGIPLERLDEVEGFVREILTDSITPPLDAWMSKLDLPDSGGDKRPVIRIDVPNSLFVHQSPNGYFRRVGSSKRPIPPEALARLFQQRSQARLIRFDEQAVPGARFEDLDEKLWRRFLREDDEDPLATLRKLRILTTDDDRGECASVAGVLMCSENPQRWFPNARIEAIRYRGNVLDSKYQVDREPVTGGPVDEQIRHAVAFADRTMRRGATKDPERIEIPQYSLRAIFEAVVNAAAHRDYSLQRSKIRLFLFDDRLELYSPGGLPNSLTVDSLPLRQATRNELLTSLLGRLPVDLHSETPVGRRYFIEKRGEGVPIILRESLELSGREPEYRLIDDEELLLTIWSAKTPNF